MSKKPDENTHFIEGQRVAGAMVERKKSKPQSTQMASILDEAVKGEF